MEQQNRPLVTRVKTWTLNATVVFGFVILIAVLHIRPGQLIDLIDSLELIF